MRSQCKTARVSAVALTAPTRVIVQKSDTVIRRRRTGDRRTSEKSYPWYRHICIISGTIIIAALEPTELFLTWSLQCKPRRWNNGVISTVTLLHDECFHRLLYSWKAYKEMHRSRPPLSCGAAIWLFSTAAAASFRCFKKDITYGAYCLCQLMPRMSWQ